MEQPKGAHASDTRTLPTPVHRPAMSSVPSTQRTILPRMQRSVRFTDTIQIHEVDKKGAEHRRGPWMRAAVDRHRFRRRIHQTGTIVEPILDNAHRDKICSLLCYNVCVRINE